MQLQITRNGLAPEVSIRMFVCLCNGIKDSELRTLAARGVRTAREAYRQLGVEMNCEDCSDHVQLFIDEALNAPPRHGGA